MSHCSFGSDVYFKVHINIQKCIHSLSVFAVLHIVFVSTLIMEWREQANILLNAALMSNMSTSLRLTITLIRVLSSVPAPCIGAISHIQLNSDPIRLQKKKIAVHLHCVVQSLSKIGWNAPGTLHFKMGGKKSLKRSVKGLTIKKRGIHAYPRPAGGPPDFQMFLS